MLRWAGISLGILTIIWLVLQNEILAWSSLAAGIALASSLFITLIVSKTEKPVELPVPAKVDEEAAKASQTIEALGREIQTLQQKVIRSEDRCLSYQKLVEVHQQEIEKLRQESQALAEQLIQKERKLSEVVLSKMDPDLFDLERRKTESLNRELKKQLIDTKSELAELAKDSKKKKKPIMAESEFRDLLS